jgi:hypothetical protein
MKIEKTITVCGIDIPVASGPIGISVSGGADSVALLYTLLTECPEKEFHIYTAIENLMDFRVVASPTVGTIIAKVIQRIGYRKIRHHVTYYNSTDAEFFPGQLMSEPTTAAENEKIAALYTGLTATPPLDIAYSWSDDPAMHEVIKKRQPNQNRGTVSKPYIMPFVNVDKTKIAEVYAHYDLMDWLYPLTFSCENTDNTFENPAHCGECWWCRERAWAFGRLV